MPTQPFSFSIGDRFPGKERSIVLVFQALQHIRINGDHRGKRSVEFLQQILPILADCNIIGLFANLCDRRNLLCRDGTVIGRCFEIDGAQFEGSIPLSKAVIID